MVRKANIAPPGSAQPGSNGQTRDNNDFVHATYINLAAADPKPYRVINPYHFTDIIPMGSDNLFPQALALFTRLSPNHRGILNSKHNYIIGDGISSEDASTQTLIDNINFEKESLTSVFDRVLTDDDRFGNVWIELITDRNKSFLYLNHLDSTKCRLAKNLEEVVIHPDWQNDTGKDDKNRKRMSLYPIFRRDPGDEYSAFRCVFHYKRYEPEFVFYGLPGYISAQDSVQIDLKTNKWNLARLKNSFRVSGVLVIPVRDRAESKTVIDYINKEHVGEDKQAKLLTITKLRAKADEKADVTQLIETKQEDQGSWDKLHAQSLSDMMMSHGWFRSLTSLPDNTGFDTKRILNEYEVAYNTVISTRQDEYIGIINKLFREVRGIELDIRFLNKAPVDDDNYKYVWELREEKGLPFDKSDPAQQIIVGVNSKSEIKLST